MLTGFCEEQFIQANTEENLFAQEIVEKNKKLADKRYKEDKKKAKATRLALGMLIEGEEDGGGNNNESKGLPVGTIHVDKPRK